MAVHNLSRHIFGHRWYNVILLFFSGHNVYSCMVTVVMFLYHKYGKITRAKMLQTPILYYSSDTVFIFFVIFY